MTHFMRKPATGSRRTTALLAVAIGAAWASLWGTALAAQAGDPPPQQLPAEAHSAAPAAAKTDKPDPDDRVICRELEAPTGSRLGAKRVCHTQRQWKQMSQDAQDWLDTTGPAHNPK